MRREVCGECGSPINDDGSCYCTELLKRGWRQCAKGQKTTQWCQMAEDVRRELREVCSALGDTQPEAVRRLRKAAVVLYGDKIPEAVVEAVARAICVACEDNPNCQGDCRGNEFRWQDYRDAALAAISAFTAAQQDKNDGYQ